jgi:hypothetical protein
MSLLYAIHKKNHSNRVVFNKLLKSAILQGLEKLVN